MKPKAYIGIDPGKTGAAALISTEGIDIFDFEDPVQAAMEIREWKNDFDITLCLLEKVHAMPKQGVISIFTFGTNFGQWIGIMAAFQIPLKLIAPAKWQKEFFSKADGDNTKTKSLTVARRLYPHSEYFKLKKHHNRADAMLLATLAMKGV